MSVLSHKGYYKMKMIAKWSRIACLRHYGLVCACCGYADTYKKITQSGRSRFFLEFDHIAGGGSKHFRERKGKTLTMWLVLNGFPSGFRTLCRGCNSAMEPNKSTCETHKWKWKDWSVIFARLRTFWARVSTVLGYVDRSLDAPNMILIACRISVGKSVVSVARKLRVPEWFIREDRRVPTTTHSVQSAFEEEAEET